MRITPSRARRIKSLARMGWTQRAIAASLGIHHSTVARVINPRSGIQADDIPAHEIERRFVAAIRAKRPRPPLS